MKLPTSQTATIATKTYERIWSGLIRGGRRARTRGSSVVWVDTRGASLNRCPLPYNRRCAAVSELVDDAVSKAAALRGVWVRAPPAALGRRTSVSETDVRSA